MEMHTEMLVVGPPKLIRRDLQGRELMVCFANGIEPQRHCKHFLCSKWNNKIKFTKGAQEFPPLCCLRLPNPRWCGLLLSRRIGFGKQSNSIDISEAFCHPHLSPQ